MEIIQLKGVSKEYGRNKIIEDVSLTIEEGDILKIDTRTGEYIERIK